MPFDPDEYLATKKDGFDPDAYLAQTAPVVDLEDVGKGFAGGLGRGTAGTLGAGGDVGNLVRRGAGWGLEKLGYDKDAIERGLAAGAQAARTFGNVPVVGSLFKLTTGEDTSQITPKITQYTGEFYEPTTRLGKYASTIGEFVPAAALPIPGSLAGKAATTVTGALGSEAAGQYFEGSPLEPYARAIGGLASGVAGAKAITPAAPTTATRQGAIGVLEGADVPLTAGQRTGSRPIQWMEAAAGDMPGAGGAATRLTERTKSGYDRAITERTFDRGELRARGVPDDVNLPDARVMAHGRQSLSDEYDRILQANTLRADPPLVRGIYQAEREYAANALPSQRTTGARDIEQIRDEIVDHLVANNGRATGTWYQEIRSRLGKHQDSLLNSDPYASNAMGRMQRELDAAMARSLPAADAHALRVNNTRYSNMKRLENAVATGTEHLSPAGVAQSVRSGRAGAYGRQTGDLDELANAGAMIMKDLPQSGTAPRTGVQNFFNIPSLLGGAAGSPFGLGGALVGAAAPSIAARAVVSRPGQAYLGNQLLPQNARDVIAQTMMQQAVSQPEGIRRNRAERERRRRQN